MCTIPNKLDESVMMISTPIQQIIVQLYSIKAAILVDGAIFSWFCKKLTLLILIWRNCNNKIFNMVTITDFDHIRIET